ncbi:hypothetical protein NTJ56_18670 [Burkholderia contaminans]|uniref:hypothetical protein n=1 Tax=Burkholderia contaminans TaxID=488447 RepID=UPI001CF508E5|nr:hypothetical protein [Burkholderia contaminans]MCA7916137.1 hypothetical protein [Burkholderia contaminans]UUX41865.1 hypothetical protein NTJ56_18670 [Burkholderia contaminans]
MAADARAADADLAARRAMAAGHQRVARVLDKVVQDLLDRDRLGERPRARRRVVPAERDVLARAVVASMNFRAARVGPVLFLRVGPSNRTRLTEIRVAHPFNTGYSGRRRSRTASTRVTNS